MMKYLAVAAAIAAAAHGVLGLNVHDFPKTSFSCKGKNAGEYYADPELSCQVYHICALGQFNRLTKMSFACPNGTLFSQSSRICNSEDKVYCPLAERYYDNVQGNIDTQDDYRNVFQLDQQVLYPLEPRRPAARRPVQHDDDYELDELSSTAAPPQRRAQNSRRAPSRAFVTTSTSTTTATTTTTTTAAPGNRQRLPLRQSNDQSNLNLPLQLGPQSAHQFGPQNNNQFAEDSPEQRPSIGNFPPGRTISRNPLPSFTQQQLSGVSQSTSQYAPPDRAAASPGAPFVPTLANPAASLQPQPPSRFVGSRPNLRRPQAATPSSSITNPTPTPPFKSTTVEPEYEYYDYEEPADDQQNHNNQ